MESTPATKAAVPEFSGNKYPVFFVHSRTKSLSLVDKLRRALVLILFGVIPAAKTQFMSAL